MQVTKTLYFKIWLPVTCIRQENFFKNSFEKKGRKYCQESLCKISLKLKQNCGN